MAKKAKQRGPDECKLELVRLSPVHAVCLCGGWRYKADVHFTSSVDAVLHVDKWFKSHRRIEKRMAA